MNPIAFKIGNAVLPPIAWFLCAPGGHGRIGRVECRNKIKTIETVEFANTFLGGGSVDLGELIDRVQRSDRFQALWLAEGLGLYFGNRALAQSGPAPQRLLTEGEGRKIPDNLLLMVHAGVALAFARHHLSRPGKTPSLDQVREATRQVAALIEGNSMAGYSGIGYEAWGMVTRFFYGKIFPLVIEAMATIDPAHVPHLWHGAGRASYFIGFMPRWKEPWPAFLLAKRENDPMRRANLLAGLASAMVIVNMKTPEVLEAILRERISRLSPQEASAFAQGIACSMVMRQDTTPDEEHTLRFVQHLPSRDIESLWESTIGGPSRQALYTIQPLLRAQRRLDHITCYRPLEEILSGAGAGQGVAPP